MIRCLIWVVLVGSVWSRTLDGVTKDGSDRPRPHGIGGDHSSGSIDLKCKDCDKDKTAPHRHGEPNTQHASPTQSVKHDELSKTHHRKGNHHRRRSKNPVETVLKPFLSLSRVKVSVTRNSGRPLTRHLPRQHGSRPPTRHIVNQNDITDKKITKDRVQLSTGELKDSRSAVADHVDNADAVGGRGGDKESRTKTTGKQFGGSTGKTKVEDNYQPETSSERLTLKGKKNHRQNSGNDNSGNDQISKDKLQSRYEGLHDKKGVHEDEQEKKLALLPDKGKAVAISQEPGDNEGDSKEGKHIQVQENKHTQRQTHRKKHRKTHRKSQKGVDKIGIAKVDDNDKEIANGEQKGDLNKHTKKQTRKRKRINKTRSKSNHRQHIKKSHSKDMSASTKELVGSKLDHDKPMSEADKVQAGFQRNSRWENPNLPQVPDVERLERRLHPKVEAPVDDIIMSLRRVLHQMQHYIFVAEHNYLHTFNTTRWEIMSGVREELLNIAKENNNVYDAVMEVSLHTKELYLRGHQRRRFNEVQATSSLPYTQRNGVKDLFLRSKHEYARDELRYAENLQRKILNLQRKRGHLRYDYVELTRKISEKLPIQALRDLGRRANRTMEILDYSRTLRDARDRTRLYGYSHNSTFSDMRIARDHINDADDIIVWVKQRYRENQVKAKEIKRARQTVHVDSSDVFDMARMEQWATVDRAKLHANDVFNTAAMILMKFKPLLKEANDVIAATKKGTQESRFDRTMRNIREKMKLLNDTMVSIRGDVCTDQYTVCLPPEEPVKEIDTYVKLTEGSSGDTAGETDEDLIESSGDDLDESSGDVSEETTETPVTVINSQALPNGKQDVPEVTGVDKQQTNKTLILLSDTDDEDIIEEVKQAKKSTHTVPKTPEMTPDLTTTSSPKRTTTVTDVEVESSEVTDVDNIMTNDTTILISDTDDEDIYITEVTEPTKKVTQTVPILHKPTTTPLPKSTTVADDKTEKEKTTLLIPDTDDEDDIDESSGDGSESPTKLPVNVNVTQTLPTDKQNVSDISNNANKQNKKTTIILSDTDDEDIIEEMKQVKKTTKSVTKTPELTTTSAPKATSTAEPEGKSKGWFWLSDSLGLLSDQVWGSDTRHKRDTGEYMDILSNITLTELIQYHLKNRSELNEDMLSEAKLRVQSLNELQDHLNKVKSTIDLFENKTRTVKTFSFKWKAKSAEFRAVHDRVMDVSKDIEFKHSVFEEQNAKSVKKAESKLKRMNEAYEANKDRVTDDSGPESAREALALADKVKDNVGAIVALKQLNPSPCAKLQSMDNMIRANISDLRYKIKQAKLLAASLQVAVTMEGNSHLEIPVANMGTTKQASNKVEMTMKSYTGNGAIALVHTNDVGSVVVTLDDFKPTVSLLDDGRYNIAEESGEIPLHNNTWYTFTLERFATDYNFTVYNGTSLVQSFMTKVDGDDYPTVYNPPSTVYIGGATKKFDLDNWNGCIGNINVNGQYLNVLKADNKKTVPKSCTVLSNKNGLERSLILDGFGHAFYSFNTQQQRSRVSMFAVNFTAQSNGTVFTVNAENNRFQAMAVVRGRRLLVTTRHYNLKSDLVSVIDVIGTHQRIEVLSDGRRSTSVLLNGRKDLLISSDQKMDVETLKSNGLLIGAASNTSRSVRGCIHGISMNNKMIQLNSMSEATSVTYGTCQENHCLTFNSSNEPIRIGNLTDANQISFVFSYGSRGGILQYSKGEKFNLNVLVDKNGLDLIEMVKDKSDTISLSESKFDEGDDVAVMITDKDKTLTVTVGEETSEFSYGGGGFWSIFSDDDDDDDDSKDAPYSAIIGSTESSDVKLQGNLLTLKISGRNMDLSQYLTPNKLQRCTLPRLDGVKDTPLKHRKQLSC